MHVQGHMGGHPGVHHGVPLSANGTHLLLDQQMDGEFYHDQEPHNVDERMMGGNFRTGQMGNFNQNRMQAPFEYMNPQQLQ